MAISKTQNKTNMELSDLEKILKAIASAPAHCDLKSQKEQAIWLKRDKSLRGFQILAESCPDLIEQSPIFHKRVYTDASTSARIIYEFGLTGAIGAAAASIGYFAGIYGDYHGLNHERVGPLEASQGSLKNTISHLINRASSIGAGLFAVGSEELNLWPKELAVMRIEEDLSSLLLHMKLTLSPFCSILIVPTGDMTWLTQKINISRAAKEAGLDCPGVDQFGRIRLEWNPPVPRVQSTPLWKMPSPDDISHGNKGHLSFMQLLKNTQEKYPQKIMLASSRSEIAKKQNSATSKKASLKKKSSRSQCTPGSTSDPLPVQIPISGLAFSQMQGYVDLEEG